MSKYDSVDANVKYELLSYMLECCQDIPGVQGSILKGAYCLKLTLQEYGYVTNRQTHDLDLDVFSYVEPEALLETVAQRICQHPAFTVKKTRINSTNSGMGIVFDVNLEGLPAFSLKIDFQRRTDPLQGFRFASPSEMLADKLIVNLGQTLERRAKDAFDLYLISTLIIPPMQSLREWISPELLQSLDFTQTLYTTEDGIRRLNHAMERYDPKPVNVTVSDVIQSNFNFLHGVYNLQLGYNVVKSSTGVWYIEE